MLFFFFFSFSETSTPAPSETWVFLLMCCGTDSNCSVPHASSREWIVVSGLYPVWEHFLCWCHPENCSHCTEVYYHRMYSLIPKKNEVIHNTFFFFSEFKNCFDSIFKLHTNTLTQWLWKAGIVTWKDIKLLVTKLLVWGSLSCKLIFKLIFIIILPLHLNAWVQRPGAVLKEM